MPDKRPMHGPCAQPIDNFRWCLSFYWSGTKEQWVITDRDRLPYGMVSKQMTIKLPTIQA